MDEDFGTVSTAYATSNQGIYVKYQYATNCSTATTATVFWTNHTSTAGSFGNDIRQKSFNKEADDKARLLLLSVLSDEQKAELKEHDRVTARGASGRLYRLNRKWAGGIMALDKRGDAIAELCLVENVNKQEIPIDDLLVARKLMIESCEEDFLKIANFHWGKAAFAEAA